MTKQEFLNEAVDLMKEMTPEERGKLLSDLMSISINLTLTMNNSDFVKEALRKSESKVV